ncbi:helix-turn-helix transcriptional regulator [Polymorphobacter fuscus]|uniref:Helix-turn-helix transcriptional regulator n=1 Tax=Sandarakinorhabdus fusca TaxID=1439888 RepID=A0A7C9KMT7_9SPHN|nr:helix-turn-helix transcriptional regulator [Polymorphobacter fuscus]KAB7647873.1 helix-turn-helix transcriptional regulator [Polymorphobacter fuscus]MQT17184.1 helix-turn-helix transcriptional regulator [Polymorphobacter fuscus]NJC08822.1 DNA-binding CsgD family transcriptional regulator [Polymorphobacter fuscus]
MDLTADLAAVSVTTVDDVRGAAEALHAIAMRCGGLRAAVCDNIASKATMLDAEGNVIAADVFGWTGEGERWWADSRLALSSPLPRACRYESEPFWANASGFRTRQPNRYLDQIGLDNFERRSLTRGAIVVPIHQPFGQIGIVTYNCKDKERDDLSAEFAEFGDYLGILAYRFVSGYTKAHRTRHWLPGDTQLTKREVECLRWASIGKTDKEISLILSRSHATVRFHIQNAGEKLDAVNRSQTIFKAAQLGYLGAAA